MSERSRASAIVQLALARFRIFYREPGAMFWTFGFPLVLSIVLGIAFRNREPEPVIVAVERIAGDDVARADRARDVLGRAADVKVKEMAPDEASGARSLTTFANRSRRSPGNGHTSWLCQAQVVAPGCRWHRPRDQRRRRTSGPIASAPVRRAA